MKNLRHSIIKMSMESISDIIIDHQTLASQLAAGVDDVSGELIVNHSLVMTPGGRGIDDSNLEAQHNSPTTPSPSPLPVGIVDVDVDDVAHSVVTTSSVDGSTITTDIDGGSVMMVRTIIDGLSHSPVQSSYQAPTPTQQQHNMHQRQQQRLQQQQHHHHRHHHQQAQHQLHQQRLSSSSPVDFVDSDVTLDALSVGGRSNSTPAAHIIDVKQEHKLVIVNQNNSSSIHNHSSRLDVSSVVGGMDELSSEAVEVTLNQHHHQHALQQHYSQQQQQQQHTHHHQHHHHSSNHNHHNNNHHHNHNHNSSNSNNSNHHNQHQQHHQQQQQHLLGIATQHVRPHHHNNSSTSHHTSHDVDHHHHHHDLDHDHDHDHHEVLSVIVQAHEDDEEDESRDSAAHMLSPAELCVGVGPCASAGGGVISDNSLEPTTYQTLTSVVNERMSSSSPPLAGFSPTSSYATLTPLQPLPPISTMSDKFAYGGHISGGGSGNVGSVGTGSNSNSSSGAACGVSGSGVSVSFMPHQSSCLSTLSLSGLSGVQSPYSAYDKLPSMSMSMSPPPHHHTHYSSSSPSGGLVVACDLHHHHPTSPTSPCGGALSPQSAYSHTTELHSPTLAVVAVCGGSGSKSNGSHHHHLHQHQQQLHQQHHHISAVNKLSQVVCLSPVDVSSSVLGDSVSGVVATGYESPYSVTQQQRDLLINTTPSSTRSGGGRNSQLQVQHSPILSPHSHSISAGSVSLHSPGIGGNHHASSTIIALPPINGSMATLSTSSLINAPSVELEQLQRDAVVSLTPSPPPQQENEISASTTTLLAINQPQQQQQLLQHQQEQLQQSNLLGKLHPVTSDCSINNNSSLTMNSNGLRLTHVGASSSNNNSNTNAMCNITHQHQQQQQNEQQLQVNVSHVVAAPSVVSSNNTTASANTSSSSSGSCNSTSASAGGGSSSGDMEEINTKELAQRISAELKRYSIPQAIFAQRVLCRSQGTLSDLLRNPKPWSKLKSGRETFRRMFKWLQEPEFQRMSALRMAAAQIPQRSNGSSGGSAGGSSGGNGGGSAVINNVISSGINGGNSNNSGGSSTSGVSTGGTNIGLGVGNNGAIVYRRKDEPHIEHMSQPKKPRLVFTDLQRRTLQAIFKETKRPSKEMQVTIARQLGLEPTTVGNFFMNARRRSMDKWRDDDSKNMGNHLGNNSDHLNNNNNNSNNNHHHHHHQSSLSPGNQHSLDLDDDGDMDLDLGHDDFDLDGDHDEDHENDDML